MIGSDLLLTGASNSSIRLESILWNQGLGRVVAMLEDILMPFGSAGEKSIKQKVENC